MDASDVFNVGIERDIYGVSISFFGILYSIQKASNGKGFGVRYGHFGAYKTGDQDNEISISYISDNRKIVKDGFMLGDSYPAWPMEWFTAFHEPTGFILSRNQSKSFRYVHFFRCHKKYTINYKNYNYICTGKNTFPDQIYNSYQIELSLGVFLGFRFNPHEFVDFLIGLVGYDSMDDDTLDNVPVYRYLPQPATTLKDWESKLDTIDEDMDSRVKKK